MWQFDVLWYVIGTGTLANFSLHDKPVYLNLGSIRLELNTFTIELSDAFFYAVCHLTIYELFFYRQDSSRYQIELARSEEEREKLRVANLQTQFDVLMQGKAGFHPILLINTVVDLLGLRITRQTALYKHAYLFLTRRLPAGAVECSVHSWPATASSNPPTWAVCLW